MEDLKLDSETQKNVNNWLSTDYDLDTREEVKKMLQEQSKELLDAFYTTLSFGTGGLRGLVGIGSNRLNVYTIRGATQGLADYLKKVDNQGKHSVCIGYDSRHHSHLFAEESAKVLAANEIQVYLFKELRPTPLVSFGCRFKKCSAAIMITASHNPPQYNGYKVYWKDGGQVVHPHDQGIVEEARKIESPTQVKAVSNLDHSLISWLEEEVDSAYIQAISSLQLRPEQNRQNGVALKIVYSNLHGTGITLMPRGFQDWGFTQFTVVPQQEKPDGDFPTVAFPNPEDKRALKLGIELLEKIEGDLFIANDPDADRVGLAVRHKGETALLTGNQVACICIEYICATLLEQKRVPEKGAFIKTIATTELFQAIAKAYKYPCFNVLIGFKYIAEKILEWEQQPDGFHFLFGGEESYGYLVGSLVRDKDAISSSLFISEIALHAKLQGKTLVDLLHEIYQKYGVYTEELISVNYPDSKEGKDQMSLTLDSLRHAPPEEIDGIKIVQVEDYLKGIKVNRRTGERSKISLVPSDALLFWLEDGSKLLIRPSGTEPKVKLYGGVVMKQFETVDNAIQQTSVKVKELLASFKEYMQLTVQVR